MSPLEKMLDIIFERERMRNQTGVGKDERI